MSRVLVAEDHPANLQLLADLLELHGHEVVAARTGPEALALAEAARPDLVLLDLMMPGLDGCEVARRLRALPGTQHLPIVALTALVFEEDEARARAAGCDAFVRKPLDTRALPALLDRLLGRAAAEPRAAPGAAFAAEVRAGLDGVAGALDALSRKPGDRGAMRALAAGATRLQRAAEAAGAADLRTEAEGFAAAAEGAARGEAVGEATLAALWSGLARLHALAADEVPGSALPA